MSDKTEIQNKIARLEQLVAELSKTIDGLTAELAALKKELSEPEREPAPKPVQKSIRLSAESPWKDFAAAEEKALIAAIGYLGDRCFPNASYCESAFGTYLIALSKEKMKSVNPHITDNQLRWTEHGRTAWVSYRVNEKKLSFYMKKDEKEMAIGGLLDPEMSPSDIIKQIVAHFQAGRLQASDKGFKERIPAMAEVEYDSKTSKYPCVQRQAKLPVMSAFGVITYPGPFKCDYCGQTGIYYIDRDSVKWAKQFGHILVQLPYEENLSRFWNEGNEAELAERSIYLKAGYCVNKRTSLTEKQRIEVLKYIISSGRSTKERTIFFLEWLIRKNSHLPHMEIPIAKWEHDLADVKKF